MKRGVVIILFIFLCELFVIAILSCKKGSGILGAGYVKPTPTPTFTPDANFSVYIHQEGTPVTDLRLDLTYNNEKKLTTKTDKNGIARFKVNEYGKWSLLINSFDDYSNQVYIVEPTTNTFFAINYGIPSLELNLVSGNEQIPINPNTLIYTVKYHTKVEREKNIRFTKIDGLNPIISYPNTVANDGDEVTIRMDIPKSFENYVRGYNTKYLDIYAYTEGYAADQKITISNVRRLTKNWMLNITADYYFMTLFAYDMDNGNTCYYAGIKNVDVSRSYNIPFIGTIKYQIKEFGTYSSGNNTVVYNGLSNGCMPGFTYYECCGFSYGCFNALAKIKTNKEEQWAWRDGMGANGYIKVRLYDDGYFDVIRRYETKNGWGQIYYHWCCTSRDISRTNCTCKNDVSETCEWWFDNVKNADITRYRRERITITE